MNTKSSKENSSYSVLQDVFLNYMRKNKVPTTVFLVNGIKLQGVITWFDNFCLLIKRDSYVQMIYKHSIATIVPNRPVSLVADILPTNADNLDEDIDEGASLDEKQAKKEKSKDGKFATTQSG